ncbi:AraC family transcriptional regulator [Tolypothrix sp. FACHB-123]
MHFEFKKGHSHLSKQFRQLTGMTPKAYRINQF